LCAEPSASYTPLIMLDESKAIAWTISTTTVHA
jgi:hypothetical protein